MRTLHPRQRAILRAIQTYTREHGYPPSIRDIQERASISASSVAHFHIQRLVKAGRLTYQAGKARSYVVVEAE